MLLAFDPGLPSGAAALDAAFVSRAAPAEAGADTPLAAGWLTSPAAAAGAGALKLEKAGAAAVKTGVLAKEERKRKKKRLKER